MEEAGRPHFGALLRQFRLDAGITQQELAERAKLSVEAISTLERGARTRPHRDTVSLLGGALELSAERTALLASARGIAHPSQQRERSEALDASLLRLVRPGAQADEKHNIPQPLTSLVGRQGDVHEIATLLREHRLVTVVGAGGVGKTRVALQLGSDVFDACPDGVWLVDLAPLTDQTQVANSVLTALQLPSTTGTALEVVVAYLKARRLLLIFDNCEHVVGRAGNVAASIMRACPQVRVLATSREALQTPGERVYWLPSLAVPPDPCVNVRELSEYSAVALFADRALAVNADFALTADTAWEVAEICRRLDGIPLAIELAAARVKVLAPRQIFERLDQRFRLLTGENSQVLPRHRTMTALIDWSYDLLSPREQTFFESLSVFAGGCTLEAVSAVCAIDSEDEVAVIDLITSLVTKSLLVAEVVGKQHRYRLLESSRQYARDKLVASGKHEHIVRRHALFYVDLAERLEHAWQKEPNRVWLTEVRLELENWRAALEWTLAKHGDVILGQRLVAQKRILGRGFMLAGRPWLRAALQFVDERTPPDLVAKLEFSEAFSSRGFGELKAALAAADRAIVKYGEVGDLLGRAHVQYLAGGTLALLGRPAEAEALLHAARETAHTLGDHELGDSLLQPMAWVRSSLGDFVGARAYLTEGIQFAKERGNEFSVIDQTVSLAENEARAGSPEAALQITFDLLAMLREPEDSQTIAVALTNMPRYLIALRKYDEARVHASQAIEFARRYGQIALVVESFQNLILVALLKPHSEDGHLSAVQLVAARLSGFVGACRTALGIEEYDLQEEYGRALEALGTAIGVDELNRQMAIGAAMTEDEAIDEQRALH